MSSPGMVFIVGMERCYTTSLAQWLVDAGLCDYFVPGVKEPALFVSDSDVGLARWERERRHGRRWLLDGSVANVWSDAALDAIASMPEARVIVCLRDQFARMVSAYRLARGMFCMPVDEWLRHAGAALKFGHSPAGDAWNGDALAPVYLRAPIRCRRAYTLIRYTEYRRQLATASEIEACDRDVERLERQSLPVRIVFEWARWRRTRSFPHPTILLNSYFASAISRIAARVDPARMMVLTLSDPEVRERLGERLPAFLGEAPVSLRLERHMASDRSGAEVPASDIERARELVAGEFAKDTREVLNHLAKAPGIDLSLFDERALFPGS